MRGSLVKIVLKFHDCGFEQFFLLNIEIDIYEGKYAELGQFKAARLMSFWNKESNSIVEKSILKLLEELKHQKRVFESSPLYWCGYEGDEIFDFDQNLFNECSQIAQRLVGNSDGNEKITLPEVYFEKIEQEIIEAIDNAEFTIWVAVYLFTNQKLFNHLVAKKNQGVNVQLIISDNEINQHSGLYYEQQFETYRFSKFGQWKNIFHTKICIIDLKQVIHGSYNWTNKANYNEEHISIDPPNRKNAEHYAKQFIKLKNKAKMLTYNIKPDYF
ncbi:hypothetical protein IQ247_30590 [Plectonema cf. radiosum LEGE 06105]|uniref:phospholipase D n=1 Tax=Plectonema cf. radiosum LEGE 06105 TaxID=945769 RepID=A0A8J7F9M7_9CYAN|nr:phospholipase D-like domain-containing protein [Plectonema radiosum]MBE9216950.1 hypothetical protein [Plectonema cf. radiosum LEGE 06105]